MIESNFLNINGIKIAYRFNGPVKAPVILFSNSLMTNLSMWDGMLPFFTDHYRVLRYDTRGQGLSDAPTGPYTIPQLAGDILSMLNCLEIERVHLVGLSLGGMVAQELAMEFPDRLNSLILCNTACEMPPRDLWDRCIRIAHDKGMAGLVYDTLRYWFQRPFMLANHLEIDRFHQMILETDVFGYIACVQAIRDTCQTTGLLKIKTPTLIIAGKRDMACSVDQSIVLNRLIADSELVVLKNAAHISNVEVPDDFASAVRGFVDKQQNGT